MSDLEPYSTLVIPTGRVPVAAFQAIFQKLTRKTDSLEKRYFDSFLINADAVSDLYFRLEQSLKHYQVKARSCFVTISISGGSSCSFASFEAFSSTNLAGLAGITEAIGLEYDFLIILPNDDVLETDASQSFKIRLTIGEEARLSYRTGFSIRDEASPPIMSYIEYADYGVATHMQAVISDWVEKSKYNDEEVWSNKALFRLREFSSYPIFLLPISALIAGMLFEPPAYSNLISPVRYLISVILVATLGTVTAIYFQDKIDTFTYVLSRRTAILVTAGDILQRDILIKQRKKAKGTIIMFWSGVVLAFIASTASNYVSS